MRNPLRNLRLHMSLDVGILAFRTEVMYERVEYDTLEITSVCWKLFKWNGEFRLYKVRR